MSRETVTFSKNFDRRLVEMEQLLSDESPCSSIYKIWADLLSLTIAGVEFQALWKLSEERCSHFKTLYPMVVLVSVKRLIPEELSASVEVEESQEDIEFPTMIDVPIFELFPLKRQNMSSGVLIRIADVIDRCRFFFLKLWYPWDGTESETISGWKRSHLRNRLKLQYDMSEGKLDQVAKEHIKLLLSEAVSIVDFLEGNEDTSVLSEEQKLLVVKNYIRKERIKAELELYETPELRDAAISFLRESKGVPKSACIIGAVGLEGTSLEMSQYLQLMCASIRSNDVIKAFTSFEEAVRAVDAGSTILLAPGRYTLPNIGDLPTLGNLGNGSTVKGVDRAENTIIEPANFSPAPYSFLTSFSFIHFENVTIQRNEGVLFTIASKNFRLKRCILQGNEDSPSVGIVIKPGYSVELIECQLYGLSIGIVAQENASITADSCDIHDCSRGVQLREKASAHLSSVKISGCSEAGIVIQTSEGTERISGSAEILSTLASKVSITMSNINWFDNKVDAFIE